MISISSCLLDSDHKAIVPQEEIDDLKKTVAMLRKQQADVETLQRAEALMSGNYWSAGEEQRLNSISSLLEESKARLEADDAHRATAAAETVRDTLMIQLAAVQVQSHLPSRASGH